MSFLVINNDCLTEMKKMVSNSIDSIVTDPPYGISFSGLKWDYEIPSVEIWKEALRLLKPGGFAVIACGTRTNHRMVCNIEDAGFEIRDTITWLYGTGFPKSSDIANGIDRKKGIDPKIIGKRKVTSDFSIINQSMMQISTKKKRKQGGTINITVPTSTQAKKWKGFGTNLKPACEFWTLARKPLGYKTAIENVMEWGTGALNIDESRIDLNGEIISRKLAYSNSNEYDQERKGNWGIQKYRKEDYLNDDGRYPANLIIDDSEEVLKIFPENTSRFFYCAKPTTHEKNNSESENNHPTVKPIRLLRYLCKLITPPNGIVLDMFCGSGSTGCAAITEKFKFCGIERDPSYCQIASSRIESVWRNSQTLF